VEAGIALTSDIVRIVLEKIHAFLYTAPGMGEAELSNLLLPTFWRDQRQARGNRNDFIHGEFGPR
jgi:hypothetical protein